MPQGQARRTKQGRARELRTEFAHFRAKLGKNCALHKEICCSAASPGGTIYLSCKEGEISLAAWTTAIDIVHCVTAAMPRQRLRPMGVSSQNLGRPLDGPFFVGPQHSLSRAGAQQFRFGRRRGIASAQRALHQPAATPCLGGCPPSPSGRSRPGPPLFLQGICSYSGLLAPANGAPESRLIRKRRICQIDPSNLTFARPVVAGPAPRSRHTHYA